jgi:hypothetical protein
VTDSPWSTGSSRRRRRDSGRFIEIVTVALLAVATVGSAWSAYQVSQWNGTETDEARISGALRIEASQAYLQGIQIVAYDASSIAEYSQAVAAENEELQAFIFETLVRPGLRPTMEEWREQYESGELPTNLLEDEEYLGELFAESQQLDADALAATERSEEAGSNADDYVQLTLFFAAALFFAGITASFRTRLPKLLLLAGATATLAAAGVLLAGYPIA